MVRPERFSRPSPSELRTPRCLRQLRRGGYNNNREGVMQSDLKIGLLTTAAMHLDIALAELILAKATHVYHGDGIELLRQRCRSLLLDVKAFAEQVEKL